MGSLVSFFSELNIFIIRRLHRLQVLLRGAVDALRIEARVVGGGVAVGSRRLQFAAERGEFVDEDGLHQRQQGCHLLIAQVVFLALLYLREVAEYQSLVDLVVAFAEEPFEQIPYHLPAVGRHFPFAVFHPSELFFQHFLLLADHVVVVEHPLVGAAHQAVALGFLNQKHVVVCDLSYALLECRVCAFHKVGSVKKTKMQRYVFIFIYEKN